MYCYGKHIEQPILMVIQMGPCGLKDGENRLLNELCVIISDLSAREANSFLFLSYQI